MSASIMGRCITSATQGVNATSTRILQNTWSKNSFCRIDCLVLAVTSRIGIVWLHRPYANQEPADHAVRRNGYYRSTARQGLEIPNRSKRSGEMCTRPPINADYRARQEVRRSSLHWPGLR